MIPVITILLLAGCVLIIASFIFKDSLAADDKSNIMTEEQIEALLENRFNQERARLEETERSAGEIRDQTERELEKLSNEKIMAVNEYSDQVMDQINKNHNEVMFLYSMLNDKQKELDEAMEQLNRAKQHTQQQTKIVRRARTVSEEEGVQQLELDLSTAEDVTVAGSDNNSKEADKEVGRNAQTGKSSANKRSLKPAQEGRGQNKSVASDQKYENKKQILQMYQDGASSLEIARKLHLGVGEVQLVLELSKERS